jgi:hypothetical protein
VASWPAFCSEMAVASPAIPDPMTRQFNMVGSLEFISFG